MNQPEIQNEWKDGWRIVLGCALAAGTGIVLLFFTFSLFVLPLAADLGVSRGAIGAIQSLIITAALGAILVGRAIDRFGFKPVYLGCMAIMAATMLVVATFAHNIVHLAVTVAVLGFFGIGTTAVATTRPVSAHFSIYRGRALGLVAAGVSISTFLFPPLLQTVLEAHGWRGGFVALAALGLLIGAPAAAWIVPAFASKPLPARAASGPASRAFLRDRDFQLMAGAMIVMGMATAGFIGQLSPLMQAEGLSVKVGALAVSLFAVGQFTGRLGGGWLLDHFDPRRIAVVLTIVPACGFLLLLLGSGVTVAALFAAFLIGLQQGAELDIFAYFVARRFPLAQYGTIYGALYGISWIGNAMGIAGVGLLHDATGGYGLAEMIGFAGLLLGAGLIWLINLTPPAPHS